MSDLGNVNKRLVSLDALRGITIAGMILVNSPGDWGHIYPPFEHARFNGLTLADLVFPFFLFIVGASIVLAFKKRLDAGVSKTALLKKVVVRSLIIFGLGVLLNWTTSGFSPDLRIAGVLQRIAICYFLASIVFLYTSNLVQTGIAVLIIITYWILMMFVPVPGEGVAVFTRDMSWEVYIDQLLLPGKMYFGTWDPEGILSTFPALVNTMLGIQAALLIGRFKEHKGQMMSLLIFGTSLLIAGILLSSSFPINKNLWTSSFVLVTCGLAALIWSITIYLVDVRKWTKMARPGIIFGANAITAYVIHDFLIYPLYWIKIGGQSIKSLIMDLLNTFMVQELASLCWAVFYVFLCFLPIWWMYRKKVFVKI